MSYSLGYAGLAYVDISDKSKYYKEQEPLLLNYQGKLVVSVVPKKESVKVVDVTDPKYVELNSRKFYSVEKLTLDIVKIDHGIKSASLVVSKEIHEDYLNKLELWYNKSNGLYGVEQLYK